MVITNRRGIGGVLIIFGVSGKLAFAACIIVSVVYNSGKFGEGALHIEDLSSPTSSTGEHSIATVDGPEDGYAYSMWALCCVAVVVQGFNLFGPCSFDTWLHFPVSIISWIPDIVLIILIRVAFVDRWPQASPPLSEVVESNPKFVFYMFAMSMLLSQMIVSLGAFLVSGPGFWDHLSKKERKRKNKRRIVSRILARVDDIDNEWDIEQQKLKLMSLDGLPHDENDED